MLSIGKLGRGQEGYYLGKVAEGAEDYYSGEAEAEGYWLGDAAEDLGLQGKVTPAQLTGMLTGENPASGLPLGLQHVSGKGPVPGFDLTFSAPKSASVLWALGGHPVAAEVKAAHASAVEAAVGYLQREACWTRRGAGGREFVQGSGFLGAGYVHRSSVITRINDQRQNIYNRERWIVAEVDREAGTVALVGIDTRGRVCVDSDYLGRLRERDGGPALEHAYAATTYQAQGATVDRAYVAVDPSMDRQEFYVAASRSREETFFYATPEVRAEREEFAPRDPYLRDGLEHIAEAAERNGAQASAHDEALRSQFAELSTAELAAQVRELRSEAGAERHNEARHLRAESDLQRYGEHLEHYPSNEQRALEQIAAVQAERAQLAEVSHEARAKAAVAEHVLSERARLAATAARVSPPDYITKELGERPDDPKKAAAWDRGVSQIEGYRTENGVVDRDNALGPKPQERHGEQQQRQARQALERTQRQLQLQRQRQRSVERSVDLGIGR